MILKNFFEDAHEWAQGKAWHLRLIILCILFYIFVRHLGSSDYKSIFKGLNLGIHELGHLIFGLFGEFLGILGGTILQLFMPCVAIFMFYRQRDYFGIAFAFVWLGTNFFDISAYIADARTLELPIVSPFGFAGEKIIHDWNYILNALGIISLDTTIAGIARAAGIFSMLIGLAFGGWILGKMISSKK